MSVMGEFGCMFVWVGLLIGDLVVGLFLMIGLLMVFVWCGCIG